MVSVQYSDSCGGRRSAEHFEEKISVFIAQKCEARRYCGRQTLGKMLPSAFDRYRTMLEQEFASKERFRAGLARRAPERRQM